MEEDMRVVYPVIITKSREHLLASIPDCEIDTQGDTLSEAIDMARDAMSLWCVSEQDEGHELPHPSDIKTISADTDDIITLVDADLDAYRSMQDNAIVEKSISMPAWLDNLIEKSHINITDVLERTLMPARQYV
jgi:predicted RNase H-like HicB family nuclease